MFVARLTFVLLVVAALYAAVNTYRLTHTHNIAPTKQVCAHTYTVTQNYTARKDGEEYSGTYDYLVCDIWESK